MPVQKLPIKLSNLSGFIMFYYLDAIDPIIPKPMKKLHHKLVTYAKLGFSPTNITLTCIFPIYIWFYNLNLLHSDIMTLLLKQDTLALITMAIKELLSKW